MGHVLELPRSKVSLRLCRVHARPRLFCYIRFRSHSPHALERVNEQDGHESTKAQSQNGLLVLRTLEDYEERRELRETYINVIFSAYATFATIVLSERKWKSRLRIE